MIVLSTPFTTPTLSIVLPSAEFGDSETLGTRTEFRSSMSGQLYSYIATPMLHTVNLTINGLSKDKREELITFLNTAAAQDTRLIDNEGVNWKGKIITDPFEFTVDGRGNCITDSPNENTSIQLVFEGTRLV